MSRLGDSCEAAEGHLLPDEVTFLRRPPPRAFEHAAGRLVLSRRWL